MNTFYIHLLYFIDCFLALTHKCFRVALDIFKYYCISSSVEIKHLDYDLDKFLSGRLGWLEGIKCVCYLAYTVTLRNLGGRSVHVVLFFFVRVAVFTSAVGRYCITHFYHKTIKT